MSKCEPALIWCPFPDKTSAREIAKALLDEKLVACANILPEIESIFDWEGKQCCENEVAILFKTNATHLDQAISLIGKLHPYESPAVMGWHCDAAHPSTQNWLEEVLQT